MYSLVGIALGYELDDRGSRVQFPARARNFFTTASRTALGPTQPPIQWVSGALSLGVKRWGHGADHSPPSSAKVEECVELYFHSPNTPLCRGAQLKHRDTFTFTFTFTLIQVMKDRLISLQKCLRYNLNIEYFH
jgi:hypothetical protein